MLKFVLSINPLFTSDYIVMILYRNRELAHCKPGDKSWTSIDRSGISGKNMDITCKKCSLLLHM